MYDLSHIVAVEKSILATLFFDPEEAIFIVNSLLEESFTTPTYRKIFNACKELISEDLPIDETFILKKIGQNYSNVIIDILSTSSIMNVEVYVQELIEQTRTRNYVLQLQQSQEQLTSGELKVDNVMETLQQYKDLNDNLVNIEFKPSKFDDIIDQKIEFWEKNWVPIPKKITIMITARGGTGKSYTTLHIAHKITQKNPNAKLLLWFSEDSLSITKSRCKIIQEMTGIKNVSNLDLLGVDTIPFHILEKNSRYSKMSISDKWYRFKRFAKDYDVILLDPLIAFYGGDENDNAEARSFMNILNAWCVEENKTIILIHHSAKGNNESRGAGAFVDAARLHYTISYPTNDDKEEITNSSIRVIEFKKDNWNIKSLVDTNPFNRIIFPDNKDNQTVYQKTSISKKRSKWNYISDN